MPTKVPVRALRGPAWHAGTREAARDRTCRPDTGPGAASVLDLARDAGPDRARACRGEPAGRLPHAGRVLREEQPARPREADLRLRPAPRALRPAVPDLARGGR